MTAVGGLVEGRLYTALVQFLSPILLLVLLALYFHWKKEP